MGPVATHLDVYQRTPNLALPMGRRELSKQEQDALKPLYPKIHNLRELCFAGFDYDLLERDTVRDETQIVREMDANYAISSRTRQKIAKPISRSSGSRLVLVCGSVATKTTSSTRRRIVRHT